MNDKYILGWASALKPEQMLDIVQRTYWKMLANGTNGLSTTDRSTLLNIANNCPYEGGPAVYKARALYRLYDREIVFLDDCSSNQPMQAHLIGSNVQQAEQVKSRVEDEKITELQVWPNPADGMLHLQILHLNGAVYVRNTFGQTVLSIPVAGNELSTSLSTSKWPTGLYLITAMDENGQIQVEKKVVIIH
ncbi:MAG: T9SS type A sorting domain-containing protein [Saprospiraceae bacterium]